MSELVNIAEIKRSEYETLGQLMVDVYSNLKGFPSPDEQPDYYLMLNNIGHLNEQGNTTVLVAHDANSQIIGGVVYYDDMSNYGSGGSATKEENCSGIRLLCVDPRSRGQGVGKALTNKCIQFARASGNKEVILHTTQAMQVAWKLYTKMGFDRSIDLDFSQQGLPVFGFRLKLTSD